VNLRRQAERMVAKVPSLQAARRERLDVFKARVQGTHVVPGVRNSTARHEANSSTRTQMSNVPEGAQAEQHGRVRVILSVQVPPHHTGSSRWWVLSSVCDCLAEVLGGHP
jgi:hypothetical protein